MAWVSEGGDCVLEEACGFSCGKTPSRACRTPKRTAGTRLGPTLLAVSATPSAGDTELKLRVFTPEPNPCNCGCGTTGFDGVAPAALKEVEPLTTAPAKAALPERRRSGTWPAEEVGA